MSLSGKAPEWIRVVFHRPQACRLIFKKDPMVGQMSIGINRILAHGYPIAGLMTPF